LRGSCVVAFGGDEVMVPASARETGKKWDIWFQRGVPPLAEASCGAIETRVAKVTAKTMLQPFSRKFPEVGIMIVYPRKYNHDGKV
jgi:hypothetical protein